MTPDQQKMHALFTEAVIRFEEAVRERDTAMRNGWDLAHVHGSERRRVEAREELNRREERVETWRAALLDAYTSLLVQGES